MTSKLILFFPLFIYFQSIAQLSTSEIKQISKIVGQDFIQLPNQKTYPYCPISKDLKVDMSTTLQNDTVGVSFKNEQLMWHDLISFTGRDEVLKLASTSYVTVAEYLEFQAYVRDSVTREHIYLNNYKLERFCFGDFRKMLSDTDALQWLNIDAFKHLSCDEMKEIDISDRALMRAIYPLNWEKSLSYNDPNIRPLIIDLYYPKIEYDYKKSIEFDERKLIYSYSNFIDSKTMFLSDSLYVLFPFKYLKNTKIDEKIATISDPFSWAKSSVYYGDNFFSYYVDEFSILAQLYYDLNLKSPIYGINGAQAKAFCHWKQTVLQKELDKNNIPNRIILTLPTTEDLEKMNSEELKFTIPERDYTEQWKIMNKDYFNFIAAVKDSILREFIVLNSSYDREAMKFLSYQDLYFENENYTEYDYADRDMGRNVFSLNYKSKINFLNKTTQIMVDSLKKTDSFQNPHFKYYYLDAKGKAYQGLFETYENDADEFKLYLSNKIDTSYFINPFYYGQGKDLDLSFKNVLNQSSSVRAHENNQVFIIDTRICITNKLKDNTPTNPRALIKGITYDQALAYYAWKYPIHKATSKDNWQDFVLPSKEQFEEIQKGKQIILPERKVEYPTPLFRYVVHVFPK